MRGAAFKGNLVPVSIRIASLVAACLLVAGGPLLAQDTAISAAAEAKTVEGATPDRVKLVDACGGHKFDSLIEFDPVKHRSTRVKLCSKPGASDADWVKTLNSAIVQIEDRNMPPTAKEKLLAELHVEVSKFAKPTDHEATTKGTSLTFGKSLLAEPTPEPQVPFEVTSLPPLPDPKGFATRGSSVAASAVVAPVKPIRASVRCLDRGQSGAGSTCDFLERDTQFALTLTDGLEKGATVEILRRGQTMSSVDLAASAPGQVRRLSLPPGICKGLTQSKIELLMMAPGTTSVAARFGPYGLKC